MIGAQALGRAQGHERAHEPAVQRVIAGRDQRLQADQGLVERGVRLLARPAFGMKTGIDHQPRRAESHRLQIAKPAEIIALVVAEFIDQLLSVERPALYERVEAH